RLAAMAAEVHDDAFRGVVQRQDVAGAQQDSRILTRAVRVEHGNLHLAPAPVHSAGITILVCLTSPITVGLVGVSQSSPVPGLGEVSPMDIVAALADWANGDRPLYGRLAAG